MPTEAEDIDSVTGSATNPIHGDGNLSVCEWILEAPPFGTQMGKVESERRLDRTMPDTIFMVIS